LGRQTVAVCLDSIGDGWDGVAPRPPSAVDLDLDLDVDVDLDRQIRPGGAAQNSQKVEKPREAPELFDLALKMAFRRRSPLPFVVFGG
jgi:hypothetical protein